MFLPFQFFFWFYKKKKIISDFMIFKLLTEKDFIIFKLLTEIDLKKSSEEKLLFKYVCCAFCCCMYFNVVYLFILCVYTDSENEDDQNERHSIGMIILSLKTKQFYSSVQNLLLTNVNSSVLIIVITCLQDKCNVPLDLHSLVV